MEGEVLHCQMPMLYVKVLSSRNILRSEPCYFEIICNESSNSYAMQKQFECVGKVYHDEYLVNHSL